MFDTKYLPNAEELAKDFTPNYKPLEVTTVEAQKVSLAEYALYKLETAGGNLARFKLDNPGLSMFAIQKELNKPSNLEFKLRWNEAVTISNKYRKDLLICKALETLENYQNISSTSSSSDVAFSRAVLFMCGTKPPAAKSASAQSEQDDYDDVERDLRTPDE